MIRKNSRYIYVSDPILYAAEAFTDKLYDIYVDIHRLSKADLYHYTKEQRILSAKACISLYLPPEFPPEYMYPYFFSTACLWIESSFHREIMPCPDPIQSYITIRLLRRRYVYIGKDLTKTLNVHSDAFLIIKGQNHDQIYRNCIERFEHVESWRAVVDVLRFSEYEARQAPN